MRWIVFIWVLCGLAACARLAPGVDASPTRVAEPHVEANANANAPARPVGAAPTRGTGAPRVDSASTASRRVDPANTSTLEVILGPSLRWLSTDSTSLFGARAAVRWRGFSFGAETLFGSSSDPLGPLYYGVGQALIGYDLLRAGLGGFALIGTAYTGLGVAWNTASMSALAQASSKWLFAWALAGQFSLERAFDAHWSLALFASAGYAQGPRFNADSRSVATLAGLFGGAGVWVAWRPAAP